MNTIFFGIKMHNSFKKKPSHKSAELPDASKFQFQSSDPLTQPWLIVFESTGTMQQAQDFQVYRCYF